MNGLRVGFDDDEELLEDLREQAQKRKARERAFYLLEYRDHTRKELVDKLLKIRLTGNCRADGRPDGRVGLSG